ncbi:MAG: TRAP transporter small permease [Pannonibacter phragmitetus]
MSFLLKIDEILSETALRLAMAFLVIATVMALYQVTTRFVFGTPSTWSEVAARSAIIWCVFLGAAGAIRSGSMISMEIVQRSLPRRLGLALYQLAMLLSFVFFVILFWQGWNMTVRVMRQTLAALEISIAWVYAALPVGAVFACIAILGAMLRAARDGLPGEAPVEGAQG